MAIIQSTLDLAMPSAGPSSSGSSPLSDVPIKPKTSNEGKEYCHQAVLEPLQCTVMRRTGKGPKAASFRCGRSYCENDLRKYGLSAAAIRSGGRTEEEEFGEHDLQTSYTWSCMACRDVCDCSTCRKKRGLVPLGNTKAVDKGDKLDTNGIRKEPKAKKTIKQPAANKAGDAKAKKAKQEDANGSESKAPKTKSTKTTGTKAKGDNANKVKGKDVKPKDVKKKIPKVKVVDPPLFERVATTLSKTEGEDRMELREFIFRFKAILGLPDRNLGPLDDFDRPIAEGLVRTLTGALLDLLREEVEDDEDDTLETCGEEMRYHADLVRFATVMRRIAPILGLDLPATSVTGSSKAQSHSNAMRALLYLDDDESAPSWAAFQPESGNRRGASKVPLPAEVTSMLLALCNKALQADKVRQELDSTGGEFEARRRVAAESKVLKEEWDSRKKKLAEEKLQVTSAAATKAWREKQAKEEKEYLMKQAKLNINLRAFINRKALRHDPLGTDKDGRTYYLLSPRHIGDDTRAPFAWASGVMVWGKGVPSNKADADDDLPHEVERWTHFGSYTDVKKLAEWIMFIARPAPAPATPKKRKVLEVSIPASAKKRKLDVGHSESSLSSLPSGNIAAPVGQRGSREQSFASDSSGLTPPPDDAELDRQMSLRTLLMQHKKYTPGSDLLQERAKDLAARLLEAAEWLELLEHLGLIES